MIDIAFNTFLNEITKSLLVFSMHCTSLKLYLNFFHNLHCLNNLKFWFIDEFDERLVDEWFRQLIDNLFLDRDKNELY